jgi:hypothetical protein
VPDPQGGSPLDRAVERLGRWTAQRSTRRSFLGRAGRAAVLVAGGASMAMLLSQQEAEARVCGQSGVAPKCATYDCNDTWGWCWYASGCCADGALKKICDCCAPNTPNPVGYCPSGTRVLCILESCGADPRLQTRPVARLDSTDPVTVGVLASRIHFPDGAPIAVIGDAEDARYGAVAASLGRVVGGPVLLVGRGGLPGTVLDELGRLGVRFATVVGPLLGGAVDSALAERGIAVERVGSVPEPSTFSAEVAAWSRPLTGSRTAVVLDGAPVEAYAPAAALAGTHAAALLIAGSPAVAAALDTPRPVRISYVVASDASAAGRWPGGRPVVAADHVHRAALLAEILVTLRGGGQPLTIAPLADPALAAAAAAAPGPLLLHPVGGLGGVLDWVLARRSALTGAQVAGDPITFADPALHDLQSAVNEFEAHLLTGSAGEGLPVIPQPREERPVGHARR